MRGDHINRRNWGVVYGASGRHYHIKYAARSAASIKRFHPNMKISLFTNHKPEDLKGIDLSDFSEIKTIEKQHARNKFDAMTGTPYDRTIYLDNDTIIKRPIINNMFRVLERFDMALTHAPLVRIVTPMKEITPCFVELNGGVIAYRKNEKVMNLLRQWEENWKGRTIETRKGHKDQPYLRKLLWESDLRIYILPPEYNVRRKTAGRAFIHHRKGATLND